VKALSRLSMTFRRVIPVIKLTDMISPSFYGLHRGIANEKYTHYWLKGGRGSTKSSFISLEIILGIMAHKGTNAVAIRKVGLYLKDSVFEQLNWAIEKLGVSHLWQVKLSPLEMIYLPTGQKILFRGADKPKKLKSTKVSKGYIRYIWYEEVDEFNGMEEIRTINQSLMRGGAKFDVLYSYNPPKSQRNWVNNEVLEQRGDRIVHHSDYTAVPRAWLGEQFIAEAEHLKQTQPTIYAHEYLGEVTGTGGEVFTNISIRPITDDEIAAFDHVRRGIDWGYGADPFSYGAMHYDSKRKRLYIYYEYYKVGAKFDAIVQAIQEENKINGIITAESAEPRSNDELKDRGLRIQKAVKGQGSVEHGITWLQNLEEIIIDRERCPNTAREFLGYELEKDNNGNWKEGFPDKDNHSIDMVRYALENDMKKSGISILK
jgi:phage terminase large subunit